MSIQSEIREQISAKPEGVVFGYDAFDCYRQAPDAVMKAVGRLVSAGTVRRLSKGLFYRPRRGRLGELPPSDAEKLKALLFRDGRRIGYVTGASLYNRLGLTSQMPMVVTLAWGGASMKRDIGSLKVRLIKSAAPVSDENIPFLELLDVLKDIDVVPDAQPDDVLSYVKKVLSRFDRMSVQDMTGLAKGYYPPRVRALLGMLLDESSYKNEVATLKGTLNPVSRYKVQITAAKWPNKEAWKVI